MAAGGLIIAGASQSGHISASPVRNARKWYASDCTHKLARVSSASALQGQESRQQRQDEARRRRRAALEELRTQRQNQELAECSFAPAKPPRPPPTPRVRHFLIPGSFHAHGQSRATQKGPSHSWSASLCFTPCLEQVLYAASELTPERQPGESEYAVPCQGPVKVPGMERYMWNKQRARQLAEEQQAREAKAFLQNPKARLEPCTVPEPFALQTELREVRHSSSISSKPIQIMAGPGLSQQHYGSHGCGMRHRHTDGNAKQVELGRDWLHTSH